MRQETESYTRSVSTPPEGARVESKEPLEETPSGWIYKSVLDGHWTAEQVDRLKGLFLSPPDRETWAIAMWGVEKCPSTEAPYWIDQYLRGPGPDMDRVHAVTVLGQRLEPVALTVLQGALAAPDEAIRLAAIRTLQVRAGWDESAKSLAVSMGIALPVR
jgi:hypothetical protein